MHGNQVKSGMHEYSGPIRDRKEKRGKVGQRDIGGCGTTTGREVTLIGLEWEKRKKIEESRSTKWGGFPDNHIMKREMRNGNDVRGKSTPKDKKDQKDPNGEIPIWKSSRGAHEPSVGHHDILVQSGD